VVLYSSMLKWLSVRCYNCFSRTCVIVICTRCNNCEWVDRWLGTYLVVSCHRMTFWRSNYIFNVSWKKNGLLHHWYIIFNRYVIIIINRDTEQHRRLVDNTNSGISPLNAFQVVLVVVQVYYCLSLVESVILFQKRSRRIVLNGLGTRKGGVCRREGTETRTYRSPHSYPRVLYNVYLPTCLLWAYSNDGEERCGCIIL